MLKRILALVAIALVAPVPTVWLFVQYGEWLYARFLDVGLSEKGADFASGLIIIVLVLSLLMVLIANIVLKADKIGRWIKTGEFHA